ncbi:MAG: hypothetical protein ABI134_19785 [Byssovorax sp.]
MKIAATFVLSAPLALVGCMGDVDDTEQNEQAAQPLGAGDAQFPSAKHGEELGSKHSIENPCLQPPIECVVPIYNVPVTPAPTYPAPRFGAPKHEAPVYKAPAYELPTYQLPGECPDLVAPYYEAPTYAGPTYQAPVYEAPVYEAPSFPAPIFERATYGACRMVPCREPVWCDDSVIPLAPALEEGQERGQGQALMPAGQKP